MDNPLNHRPLASTDAVLDPFASHSRVSSALVSPGIASGDKSEPAWQAFELKFVIPEAVAQEVQRWALEHLELDPYSDRSTCMYQTTTLYLDTPGFDVLNRNPGFRRRKFRLRRYGDSTEIHLERKARSKDQVRKRRTSICESQLARLAELHQAETSTTDECWAGDWFHQRIARRQLRPALMVTYSRAAFMKLGAQGVMRLTLDRSIRGVPTQAWQLAPVTQGDELLPGQVVCELKFRETMPSIFKQLASEMRFTPGSVSKYRRLMHAAGFAPQEASVSQPAESANGGG